MFNLRGRGNGNAQSIKEFEGLPEMSKNSIKEFEGLPEMSKNRCRSTLEGLPEMSKNSYTVDLYSRACLRCQRTATQ